MDVPPLFFERHPNPMLIFDSNTLEILAVNQSAVKKYGYSEAEFTQLSIEDIRLTEDIPLLHKQLNKLEKEQKAFDLGTFRHRTKRGEILYVQLTTQQLPFDGIDARIVHIHDITSTLQLKKEVEEASSDQRHHIDNNPLGMVKFDQHFRVIEWSKRAEHKTGYTKNEVFGIPLFEMNFFDGKDAEIVKKRVLKLASGENKQDRFETVIRLKNGSKMDVMIHASALRDKEGELKSVLAFIQNISDRKEYQRQLEQREQKYHRLFEDANDGIFLINGLTIIDCNQRVTEIIGGSKEEIIGKTPLDFSPDRQPDGQLSAHKAKQKINLASKGKPQVFEWKHNTIGGEIKDVEVSLNKIELGEDTYIQAILRDLTEQKKVKNELEDERQRLKRAQGLARMGWWNYDVKQDQVIWSDVLFDILEVDRNNFGGTFDAFYKLVHPRDREQLNEVMELAQQTQEPIDYLLRILNKNNKIIYAKCRAQGIFNTGGELVQLSGVLQDVTEQKKAQAELKRRKELFESLFLDAPVAIAMIDTDGSVQKINDSFNDLFGYSEMELVGKDLLKHQLPKERYGEIEHLYDNVFSDDAASRYYEDRRLTKKGEVKHLLVGALPVIIDGDPIAAFGMYTDITKLRTTEEHLQESLKEKEILLSEIHHRVKNNMAIVSGLMFLEELNFEEGTKLNSILTRSRLRIHSMAKIHEKLYQSGSLAKLSLKDYISDQVDSILQSKSGETNRVQFTIDCEDIYLSINQAVPCALIINELVINALQYAFEGGRKGELEVTLNSDKELISIVVADNGLGLPDNFEEMAEKSTSQQIINQLVNQLNGNLNIDSGKDKGTLFEITFIKMNTSGSASNYFS